MEHFSKKLFLASSGGSYWDLSLKKYRKTLILRKAITEKHFFAFITSN